MWLCRRCDLVLKELLHLDFITRTIQQSIKQNSHHIDASEPLFPSGMWPSSQGGLPHGRCKRLQRVKLLCVNPITLVLCCSTRLEETESVWEPNN